ncbi:MAG: hypothetical protein K6E53_12510, partial [Lachnospiraceae bacterium]|nr:hypothetical protein [Lachnospiraceae bacterium]
MKVQISRKITATVLAVLMVLSVCDTGVYALDIYEDDTVVEGETIAEDREDDLSAEGFTDGITEEVREEVLTENLSDDGETKIYESLFEEAVNDEMISADIVSSDSVPEDTVSQNEVFREEEESIPGYIDNDFTVDMPESEGLSADGASDTTVVPSKYTLEDNLYVSSVKDQGAWA